MATVNEFMFKSPVLAQEKKIWHESDIKTKQQKKTQAISCSETMNNLKGL